jgi:hypothetical protein
MFYFAAPASRLWALWGWVAAAESPSQVFSDSVKEVSSWPERTLNIGLFGALLAVCYFFLRRAWKQLDQEKMAGEKERADLTGKGDRERSEYIESLKTVAREAVVVIERNTQAYQRTMQLIERLESRMFNARVARLKGEEDA